jgi:hypothetical protein
MNTEAEKSVIYGRMKTGFFEGEKANFDAGLNCKTPQSHRVALTVQGAASFV